MKKFLYLIAVLLIASAFLSCEDESAGTNKYKLRFYNATSVTFELAVGSVNLGTLAPGATSEAKEYEVGVENIVYIDGNGVANFKHEKEGENIELKINSTTDESLWEAVYFEE
jgi:hypothetical protein